MDYFCSLCDKTIKIKSENYHLRSLAPNQFEKCLCKKHTIENTNFFDVDDLFNEYITNHNQKFDLYVNKFDFILFFDIEFYPDVKPVFPNNTSTFPPKSILLNCFENFSERGFKISSISEMIDTTISNKRYMTYECYIKQPMQMVELNLNMIIFKSPHLIKALEGSISHHLIRKYSLNQKKTNTYLQVF